MAVEIQTGVAQGAHDFPAGAFGDVGRMDVPPFMEVSKKNFFKKNFRKHLVVTIKSLTFASAFGNDGKI